MSDTIRCVQDYDSLYEVKLVGEQMMQKSPTDHWHTKYELVFVTEGKGEHYVNGEYQPVEKGDVFIVSPADFHRYHADEEDNLKAIRINFSNAFYFYYLNPNCRFNTFPVFAKLQGEDLERAEKLAELLSEEYQSEDSLIKNELCRNLIEQILILTSRNCTQSKNDFDDKLKKALDYIHNNFYKPIKISDVAGAVSYAPNYLSSQFTKKLGISISDYLKEIRLYYARELLMFSDFSISEICYKSGFKTMTYFSKAFKGHFNQAPNDYRVKK